MTIYRFAAVTALFLAVALSANEVMLRTAEGKKLPAGQKDVKFEYRKVKSPAGTVTVEYKLTSLKEGVQKFLIDCTVIHKGKASVIFNGNMLLPPKVKKQQQRMLYRSFPMGAVWEKGGTVGKAVALGIEDHHSFADLLIERKNTESRLTARVYAALMRKGAVYTGKFHLLSFNSKYGEKDAFARYYQLYPHRFKRNPAVDPRIYKLNAAYGSWRTASPEACRFADAGWDWGIGSIRHWGDVLNDYYDHPQKGTYMPKGFSYTPRHSIKHPYYMMKKKMPKERFEKIQAQRVRDGYYCGVINAWYLTILSRIHPDIAAKYPDSLAGCDEKRSYVSGYIGTPYIYTFPETSWGRESRRLIRELLARHDLGALAFDIPLPGEIYRGTKLPVMDNVGWDQYGPGVIRGRGSNMLYDYIRTIRRKSGEYNVGVAFNGIRDYSPSGAYADSAMVENNPWNFDAPWPQYERYTLGEKSLTFWEGYNLTDFDPNIKKWDKKLVDMLTNDLSRFTAHRSFYLAVGYSADFINEYLQRLAPAFNACTAAGWKPVPGMTSQDKELTLTRYGLGNNSILAVCNTGQKDKNVLIRLFPEEINSEAMNGSDKRAPLYAGYFGSAVVNSVKNGVAEVSFPVGRLRLNLLEAVGRRSGGAPGSVTARWQGGLRRALLTLESQDHTGKVELNAAFGDYQLKGSRNIGLVPGKKVTVVYENSKVSADDKIFARFPLLDKNKQPLCQVHYSAEFSAQETAERVKAFFYGYGRFTDKNFKLRKYKNIKKTALPPFTVVITRDGKYTVPATPGISGNANNIIIRGKDRLELMRLMTITLNALNELQFPEYFRGSAMDQPDRNFFRRIRF